MHLSSIIRPIRLLFIASLLFISCEKVIDDIAETSVSAEDAVVAETAIASAFDIMDDIASTDGRVQKTGTTLLPIGAELVFTDSLFTDGNGVAFYVNFGPYNANAPVNGLKCADGKFRSGRIDISVSKPYTEVGCVVNAEFPSANSYYVGNGTFMSQLLGSLLATRSGSETINVEIQGLQIITREGNISFSSKQDIKRTIGTGNVGTLGDEFEVTGSGNGINRRGEPFDVSITKTLVKRVQDGCSNTFIIGEVEVKNQSATNAMVIDFDPDDDGACDRKVLVTLPSGIKKEIIVD